MSQYEDNPHRCSDRGCVLAVPGGPPRQGTNGGCSCLHARPGDDQARVQRGVRWLAQRVTKRDGEPVWFVWHADYPEEGSDVLSAPSPEAAARASCFVVGSDPPTDLDELCVVEATPATLYGRLVVELGWTETGADPRERPIRRTPGDQAERVAAAFHQEYEAQAPRHGYTTREESAKPWGEVPEQNRRLMCSVVQVLLDTRRIAVPRPRRRPVALPIVSTRRELLGAHEHINVWVDGRKAGHLTVGPGEASELTRRLEGPDSRLPSAQVLMVGREIVDTVRVIRDAGATDYAVVVALGRAAIDGLGDDVSVAAGAVLDALEDGTLTGAIRDGQGEVDALLDELEAEVDAQRCRRCGCTTWYGCADGCHWVAEDLCNLCDDAS